MQWERHDEGTLITDAEGKRGVARAILRIESLQPRPDEMKANANLIAAAPELLAALEVLDREFSKQFSGPDDCHFGLCDFRLGDNAKDIWLQIRKAIALAKGDEIEADEQAAQKVDRRCDEA